MKYFVPLVMAAVGVMGALNAEARDEHTMFSIEEAMSTEDAKSKLDKDVHFYFGDQKHPSVQKSFGEVMTNKKTNAFNKTDERACQWAFLSAMVQFQDRAIRDGGNAIINIRSFYKRNEISSSTQFECGAGNVIAGVTFKGDVVKLAK